ncbi:hypothetical protein [Amycolatopsis keratiniphila]|uniref:hypothetical protein n=1 Tax=Amycolatopsis keratiniphila TaxID=129921 RepID=UPI000F4E610E|nr:hypothetical protein [Amycolatopsis keratiniphila]
MEPDEVLSRRAELSLQRIGHLAYVAKASSEMPIGALSLAIATEVETFTDHLLEDLIELSSLKSTGFGAQLVKSVGSQFYQSWPERKKWLKSFGVWVSPDREQELFSLADLRNSMAHGAGRLTKFQKREFSSQMSLESNLHKNLDFIVEGGQLHSGYKSMDYIVRVGRAYLTELDDKSCAKFPALRKASY